MITYRPFTAADAEAMHAVARVAWPATYATIFSAEFIEQFVATHYAPERLRQLEMLSAAGTTHLDLACDETAVIGFCQIGWQAERWELLRLYLLPQAWGRGIGWHLLQRGEAFVQQRGGTHYGCFVHRENQRALRFYQRNGLTHIPAHDHGEEYWLEKHLGS